MAHAYSYQHSSSKAAEVLGQGSHGDGGGRYPGSNNTTITNNYHNHQYYYHRPRYYENPPKEATLSSSHHGGTGSSAPSTAGGGGGGGLPDAAVSPRGLLWKLDARLLPLWILIYYLYTMDLTNLALARTIHPSGQQQGGDLATDTNTTEYLYKVAATVSLASSALFAVPSTLLLAPLLPSRWLAVLLFAWGATSMCLAVAASAATLAGLRFLAGAFRAAVAPALVCHLAAWYRADERALRLALVLGPAAFLAAFDPAVAASVPAWRWLFIAEGAPSCVGALLVLFLLPDFPARARWLSPAEKDAAARRLEDRERQPAEGGGGSTDSSRASALAWMDARAVLLDPRLYGHCLAFFAVSVPVASLILAGPSITAGLAEDGRRAQLLLVPPFLVALVAQLAVAWSADRFNARALHVGCSALLGVCGYLPLAVLPGSASRSRYACFFFAAAGSASCVAPLLGWFSASVGRGAGGSTSAAATLATALNVGIAGVVGQIIALWVYKDDEAAQGHPTGNATNTVFLFALAAIVGILRFSYGTANQSRGPSPAQNGDRGGGSRYHIY